MLRDVKEHGVAYSNLAWGVANFHNYFWPGARDGRRLGLVAEATSLETNSEFGSYLILAEFFVEGFSINVT